MSIPCIICGTPTVPFMRKHFTQFNLGDIDYDQCPACGFVLSRTHYTMSDDAWETLNHQWVSQYQGTDENPEDPRWMERCENQSAIIGDAASQGLLPAGRWLDYGAGDGKLCNKLAAEHGLAVEKYEHSSNPAQGYLRADELTPKGFDVVIHTAVIEHLRFRSQIDAIFNLVREDGVMVFHTLVPETIPHDPDWFFLLSVHCSFFTNRSMQLLFEQHGYRCSVYHVTSRLWFWFKQPASIIRPLVEKANARGLGPAAEYLFKEGFVDYWK